MVLPQHVKKFIEANIDYIENEDWESLFKNWYIFGNDYYWEELVDCLNHAGIDILSTSVHARQNVILNISKALIANLLTTSSRITVNSMFEALRCYLGLEDEVLEHIFDQAAKSEGLARATNGWYRL